ncbi:MAG: hypothetical protein KAG34_12360 [Cocleimonas sp.]|nr:hypothetical protein [Cocleimonas sp.]
MFSKFLSVTSLLLLLVSLAGLSGCGGDSPKIEDKITKALKKFDTEEQNMAHQTEMRKYHMDHLKHKRDLTMYDGIRTPEDSLTGCIDCHVPAPVGDKVVRHTDPEHFCTTCHSYVSVQIDCFQCHTDHPDGSKSSTATKSKSDDLNLATGGSTATSETSAEVIAQ